MKGTRDYLLDTVRNNNHIDDMGMELIEMGYTQLESNKFSEAELNNLMGDLLISADPQQAELITKEIFDLRHFQEVLDKEYSTLVVNRSHYPKFRSALLGVSNEGGTPTPTPLPVNEKKAEKPNKKDDLNLEKVMHDLEDFEDMEEMDGFKNNGNEINMKGFFDDIDDQPIEKKAVFDYDDMEEFDDLPIPEERPMPIQKKQSSNSQAQKQKETEMRRRLEKEEEERLEKERRLKDQKKKEEQDKLIKLQIQEEKEKELRLHLEESERAKKKALEDERARLKAKEDEKARLKAKEDEKARLKALEDEKARIKAKEEERRHWEDQERQRREREEADKLFREQEAAFSKKNSNPLVDNSQNDSIQMIGAFKPLPHMKESDYLEQSYHYMHDKKEKMTDDELQQLNILKELDQQAIRQKEVEHRQQLEEEKREKEERLRKQKEAAEDDGEEEEEEEEEEDGNQAQNRVVSELINGPKAVKPSHFADFKPEHKEHENNNIIPTNNQITQEHRSYSRGWKDKHEYKPMELAETPFFTPLGQSMKQRATIRDSYSNREVDPAEVEDIKKALLFLKKENAALKQGNVTDRLIIDEKQRCKLQSNKRRKRFLHDEE